ncbi:MAG: nuclear transport factor 2 family protein [Ktedonobacteraceae bacterium]|nr:nuclear transport factor 2 family protein [Ktedonobacteraceae bacterium]
MTQQNVSSDLLQDIVRQWIAAFNAHDATALVSLYTDNAELFDSGMQRPRSGRAEIEQWFVERFRSMPSITYMPSNQILMANNRAAVTWTTSGHTPRRFGLPWLSRPFQTDGVSVFTLQDGRILQQRGYYDHLAVVEQVLPPLKLLPSRL